MSATTAARATTDVLRVPFVDLGRIHAPLKAQILADVGALVDAGAFANGPAVAEFERAFADFCGTAFVVGVASGLDALRLSLIALGAGPGDEVIVPADTFIATVEAVAQAGAVPVLVDVSESDYNLDVAAVEAALTSRTRALLPVHLYGQLADMRVLGALAERHGLFVLEDACQAHGASRDGAVPGVGTAGAAFSFYPGKNLGAMGDAGAVATADEQLAVRLRVLREHGQTAKYRHELEGFTSRLDTIQAIVLLHKLPHLAAWNHERRQAASAYAAGLEGVGDLVLPAIAPDSNPVWHLYVVQTEDPVALGAFLGERGIGTGRHYPLPPHLSPAYARLGYSAGAFPVTERLAARGLSLPVFAGITGAEVECVIETVQAYFDG
jgi:dTDP-4-amino-4,6-dideoxygalactose transaminase